MKTETIGEILDCIGMLGAGLFALWMLVVFAGAVGYVIYMIFSSLVTSLLALI